MRAYEVKKLVCLMFSKTPCIMNIIIKSRVQKRNLQTVQIRQLRVRKPNYLGVNDLINIISFNFQSSKMLFATLLKYFNEINMFLKSIHRMKTRSEKHQYIWSVLRFGFRIYKKITGSTRV